MTKNPKINKDIIIKHVLAFWMKQDEFDKMFPRSIEDIAALAGCHRSYIYKLLNETFGKDWEEKRRDGIKTQYFEKKLRNNPKKVSDQIHL